MWRKGSGYHRAHPTTSAVSERPSVSETASPKPEDGTSEDQEPLRPRIPTCIEEVDNGRILGFGADLGEDHPGFHDEEYKQRRVEIARRALSHRPGQPIADVEYTAEEQRTWAEVVRELVKLLPTHACTEFWQNWHRFDFGLDRVPQLQVRTPHIGCLEVHEVLQQETGWSVRPVAGLMHPRDFLNGLAFKTFHSTQYMRHHSQPMYTPEPDLCHELLGHVPMLADQRFCDMVQAIGEASLGASEKDIWHLTKVYWYTVEFGVILEGGEPHAFGAGILSSFGELANMRSGHPRPELQPFNPFAKQPRMSYKDGFQKRFFYLESFDQGRQQLIDFAKHTKLNGGFLTT